MNAPPSQAALSPSRARSSRRLDGWLGWPAGEHEGACAQGQSRPAAVRRLRHLGPL